MKNVLLCTFLIILFSCPAMAGTIGDVPDYYEEGLVLVVLNAPKYEESVGMDAYTQLLLEQAEAFAKKYGLVVLSTNPGIAKLTGGSIIALRSEDKSTEELIKELSSDPDVISVSPNHIYYPDPDKSSSGGCNACYDSIFLIAGVVSLAINRKKLNN